MVSDTRSNDNREVSSLCIGNLLRFLQLNSSKNPISTSLSAIFDS